MKKNRRFRIFIIWLAEVNLLLIGRVLFPLSLESMLVSELVKYATYMAVFTVVGLSGTHMIYDWANGRKKADVGRSDKPLAGEKK